MASTMNISSINFPPPTTTNLPFFGVSSASSCDPLNPSSWMQRSIRNVMSRWGAANLHDDALLPSYRCLRRRRTQEDNQAVAVTQDDKCFKIMVDVRDFAAGTLSVRAVGENELVIEGMVEKEEKHDTGNSKSMSSSSKKFQQRFTFPGLQVDGVVSTVSSDGILTITAPRKPSPGKVVEYTIPITSANLIESPSSSSITSSISVSSQQTTVSKDDFNTGQAVPASQVCQQTVKTETSSGTAEHIIPITIANVLESSSSTAVTSNISSSQSSGKTAPSIETSQEETKAQVTTDVRGEHIVPIQIEGNSGIKSCDIDAQSPQSVKSFTEKQDAKINESDKTTTCQTTTQQTKTHADNTMTNVPVSVRTFGNSSFFDDILMDSIIPVDSKGMFFKDSFFVNSHSQFQDAVNQVFKRVSSDISVYDPINWYNNYRSNTLLEDTRAGTITTEGNNYKIVLDVRDFEQGSVSVRAIGASEVLVEGKVEKKTEGSFFSRSFRKRFILPGFVKAEKITSALSSDGVLTITAPKKESSFKLVELTGSDVVNLTNKNLANSSVFGSCDSPCETPLISMPPSSVTSPTSEVSGPFEPKFSKIRETPAGQQQQQINGHKTDNETSKSVITGENKEQVKNISGSFSSTIKLIDTKKEHVVPIQFEKDTVTIEKTNEKIVNVNYVDKNQSEIDHQNRQENNQQQKQDIKTVEYIDSSKQIIHEPKNVHNIEQQQKQQYQITSDIVDSTKQIIHEPTVQQSSAQITCNQKTKQSLTSSENREIGITLASFPIVRRGNFYQDSIFNDVHSHFQSAVRQVLDKWVDVPSFLTSSMSHNRSVCSFDNIFHKNLSSYRSILDQEFFDDFTCYRSLRHRNFKEESQAASVTESIQNFKIVIDVHGFSEKDLTVRATCQNELIVEGKVEVVEGRMAGSGAPSKHILQTFKKQFILPGLVRMEAVYSALSEDGVLTITVPKSIALSITN